MSGFCGIDLNDYIPYKRNYDAVTYVHKKYLEEEEKRKKKEKKKKSIKELNNKEHDGKLGIHNDYVTEQTIRFAEQLAPLVIPPEDGQMSARYRVKACNKCKRRNKKSQTSALDYSPTLNSKKSKKVLEVYTNKCNVQKESTSRESFSSTSNTLDDLNNNHSMSCTISEQIEYRTEKIHKKEVNHKRKRNDSDKVVVSESFEALVTELNDSNEKKIKIHLMNDTEKHNLTDSIRIPVLNALKDCLSEINNEDLREEMKMVQRNVTSNTQILNNILNRLEIIEKHILLASAGNTPRKQIMKSSKASTLERLGEDINDIRNASFEEDVSFNQNAGNVQVLYRDGPKNDDLGGGEVTESKATASVGVKADRIQRLPARFCWTDANRDKGQF